MSVRDAIRSAGEMIQGRLQEEAGPDGPLRPAIAVVLGSGLGGAADDLADKVTIPYKDIPGFPTSGVIGHAGELRVGRISGVDVAIMVGRVHMYEGYSASEAAFPVRVLSELGVKTVTLTNAAGSLNPQMVTGDLMLIVDQINMTGASPIDMSTKRDTPFIDMGRAYDPRLWEVVTAAAAKTIGRSLHIGVYVGVKGPQYETAAELKLFRAGGGDAIGMSTVIECIAAREADMRVIGISVITNMPLLEHGASHKDVVSSGSEVIPDMKALLAEVLVNHQHA